MKPETTEDILEMLDGYIVSAALGTAMELGLFWLLADKPLSASAVAESLSIPLNRCHTWLQLLCRHGLIEEGIEGYVPSLLARETVLNAQSQHFWAFHAREDRVRSMSVRDLASNIRKPISAWEAVNLTPPDEYQQIREDACYAADFTRMLYEIHISLAEEVTNLLDLKGVKRLLDLGGGSGVVSFALLRKQHELTSVVVDVETVCQTGREIASENGLAQRITYLAADFLQDDLPSGFDMVLLCDVGSFSDILFRKIHDVLNRNGRLVVVDKFAPTRTDPPPSRLSGAFLSSLDYPEQSINFTTVEMVQARLQEAGFRDSSTISVPHKDNLRWNLDWTMLEARK
jgi:cyclopropane fatty-acyl-phospholipid synthase-like methyltransferase